MKFKTPLIEGRLIKRYKRFLADVELSQGEITTAHCPNTGSMKSCGEQGDAVYLELHQSKTRKLPYTWELTKVKGGFVGINTMRTNHLVLEAIENQVIPELVGYEQIKKEVTYRNSRIDFCLINKNQPPAWIEVKNVTLFESPVVQFPDAQTKRGLKHIEELRSLKKEGNRAILLFVVNRPEGEAFELAEQIDPDYAAALRLAQKEGVEILCYRVISSPTEMLLSGIKVPLRGL